MIIIIIFFVILDHFSWIHLFVIYIETNNVILLKKEKEIENLITGKQRYFQYFQSLVIITFDSSYDDYFVVSYTRYQDGKILPRDAC